MIESGGKPAPEAIRDRLATMVVLVAVESNAAVVGTVAGSCLDTSEGHLRGMAVAPTWQGSGVADDLLAAIEAELRALGCGRWRIVARHVVPQSIPSITVAATLGVAFAVLLESALSFLGLGVQPPAASWGNMLSGARGYLRTAPGLAVLPGLLIFATVLCYNWFGDGLRDAIDPTLRER